MDSNVTDTCMEACAFDELNFERVMNRDECIPDFGKLMRCAAGMYKEDPCCVVCCRGGMRGGREEVCV